MDKREELAKLAHEQWSGWMEYLFSKCETETQYSDKGGGLTVVETTGRMIIPKWAVDRWKRQMNTPYNELSKDEKDSDRKEADKFLKVFNDE